MGVKMVGTVLSYNVMQFKLRNCECIPQCRLNESRTHLPSFGILLQRRRPCSNIFLHFPHPDLPLQLPSSEAHLSRVGTLVATALTLNFGQKNIPACHSVEDRSIPRCGRQRSWGPGAFWKAQSSSWLLRFMRGLHLKIWENAWLLIDAYSRCGC